MDSSEPTDAMDPKDRILEYALGRLDRPLAEVDLAGTVRAAWERGATGPDISELEILDPLPSLNTGPVAGSHRSALWAAAAALLVGVGLWIAKPDPAPEPTLVAELSRPLPVRLDGAWHTGDRTSRDLGEPIWVNGIAPVRVSLPGGGTLAVVPGTRFSIEEDGVRLEWGSLEISTGERGLHLLTRESLVQLAPGSVLASQLDWDHRAPSPEQLHLIEPAHYALAQGVGRLRLELSSGRAELLAPAQGGRTWRLASGTPVTLALGGLQPHLLDPGAQGELEDLLTNVVRSKEYTSARMPWAALDGSPLLLLLEQLAREPAAWVDLFPTVEAYLAKSLELPSRRRLLDMLVADGSRSAQRLVEAQWASHPRAFTVDHLVAMAEREHPIFLGEVRAIVILNDPTDRNAPHVNPDEWLDPLLPAAFLALRGDELGSSGLGLAGLAAAAESYDPALDDWRPLIAAMALEAGGFGGDPWRACAMALEQDVLDSLERGALEEATIRALTWQGLVLLLEQPRGELRLAFLPWQVMTSVGARFPELNTEAQVRALVRDLAGR